MDSPSSAKIKKPPHAQRSTHVATLLINNQPCFGVREGYALQYSLFSSYFSGLKLEEGLDYSQLVESSFHISQATIDFSPDSTPSLVAVHAEIHETDYILCYLGKLSDSTAPIIQQSLNLEIASGEKLTLYMEYVDSDPPKKEIEISNGKVASVCKDSNPSKKGCVKSVHLTGYFTEAGGDLETIVSSECEDEGMEEEVKVELNGDSVPSIATLSVRIMYPLVM